MKKITYSNLKLKTDISTQNLIYNNMEIEVLKYLPWEDKYSLISITLQNSLENNFYNSIKVDMFFHLYLVFLYSNIVFTDKQKEDPVKLYDNLKSNGLIDSIINLIPEDEYQSLYLYLQEEIEKREKIKLSVSGLLQSLITDLPKQANIMAEIMDKFDAQKFQEVINFAKAANGGRDI